jgi:hypothetical protein
MNLVCVQKVPPVGRVTFEVMCRLRQTTPVSNGVQQNHTMRLQWAAPLEF